MELRRFFRGLVALSAFLMAVQLALLLVPPPTTVTASEAVPAPVVICDLGMELLDPGACQCTPAQ